MNMIFLDQKGVKQACSMVVATASTNSIFLCHPEAGQGFACIQYSDS